MRIIYTKSYNTQLKKLKKYPQEQQNLYQIKEQIHNNTNFNDLCSNPLVLTLYKFEALKYQNSGYYSFNLNRNGGTIRLIVKPTNNLDEIELVYISYKHYEDFNPKKVIYYDE